MSNLLNTSKFRIAVIFLSLKFRNFLSVFTIYIYIKSHMLSFIGFSLSPSKHVDTDFVLLPCCCLIFYENRKEVHNFCMSTNIQHFKTLNCVALFWFSPNKIARPPGWQNIIDGRKLVQRRGGL
jgi:hypothetical protein